MDLKCVRYNLTTINDELVGNVSRHLPEDSQSVTAGVNALFWWTQANVSTHQNTSAGRSPFVFTFEPHYTAPPRSIQRYGLGLRRDQYLCGDCRVLPL